MSEAVNKELQRSLLLRLKFDYISIHYESAVLVVIHRLRRSASGVSAANYRSAQ